ncbi:hypothetical protein ETAE_1247 [Edwardsiella piscicida]|uniref:Uncharacterized protein n=2 Tax=Edwardsiella TaxID=635 RepID=A0A0H3DPF5_EDWTF|nr:hypothetical protein ETAE_1247 [Edwardsiella tarda EIB202]ADM41278.1 hypothetical protein ETAF_3335 [Edwardsiella tarda FL6-60]
MRSPDSRCQTGRYYQGSRHQLELIKDKKSPIKANVLLNRVNGDDSPRID